MPIKKAAFKALRQMKKKMANNSKIKSEAEYLLRKSRSLIKDMKLKEATDAVKKTVVTLDRAVQNGILKKNTVSRLKSRLMKSMHLAGTKGSKK